MKNILLLTLSLIILNASCKKNDNIIENPEPVEQELITAITLSVKDLSSGVSNQFTYKVENGIGTANPGTPIVDTVILDANDSFEVTVNVRNDKADDPNEIMDEIIEEKDDHLFIWQSQPGSGAGSFAPVAGDKDNEGKPFNRVMKIATGDAGKGAMVLTLKHKPTNKNAAKPDEAGGETDAAVIFPLILK